MLVLLPVLLALKALIGHSHGLLHRFDTGGLDSDLTLLPDVTCASVEAGQVVERGRRRRIVVAVASVTAQQRSARSDTDAAVASVALQ